MKAAKHITNAQKEQDDFLLPDDPQDKPLTRCNSWVAMELLSKGSINSCRVAEVLGVSKLLVIELTVSERLLIDRLASGIKPKEKVVLMERWFGWRR